MIIIAEKKKSCGLLILLLGSAAAAPSQPTPPTVASLGSDWLPNSPERDSPSINAFANSLGTSSDDLFSFGSFIATPFNSGTSLGAFRLNNTVVRPEYHRWTAYEASRRAEYAGLNLSSNIRLGFERPVVLVELQINRTAGGASTEAATVELSLAPLIRHYTSFPWVQL